MKKTRYLWIFLALVLALSACGPKEIILKFRPEVGATYQVNTVMDQSMTQTFNGAPTTITQHFEYGYAWHITDIDENGNATVEVTYNHVATSQTFGDQTLSYDSNTDEEVPPELTGLDLMLGQGFTMTVSPRGEILDISGLDQMYENIIEASNVPDEQKDFFYQGLKDSYGEEALSEQLSSLFAPYDEQPATVGHSWHIDQAINGLMPINIASDYTISDISDDEVTIEVSSTLQSDPEQSAMLSGYEVNYDMTGTQTGSFIASIADGITSAATLEQHLEGSMNLAQGNIQINVPLEIDTTLSYQMVKQ